MSNIEVNICRCCGASKLRSVLDLGMIPVVNQLHPRNSVAAGQDYRYPLRLVRCRHCGLVQTDLAISKEVIFGVDYPYLSSCSSSLLEQAERLTSDCCHRFGIDESSFVVEIASNDGYLLRHFSNRGIESLGIDPSPIPTERARAIGVNTLQAYFGTAVAADVIDQTGHADLIVANNVLAHVYNVANFLCGIKELLAQGGVFIFEVQYLADLLKLGAFDMIYHEHQCYFTMTVLVCLLDRHGLRCFDVEHIAAQGGSLRVYATLSDNDFARTPRLCSLLEDESMTDLGSEEELEKLQQHVTSTGESLRDLLGQIRSSGRHIAAYGASAKGAALVNICQLSSFLDYVVDLNPVKQDCYLPGTCLPIVAPQHLRSDPPSHLLILAWNLAEEIMSQLAGTGLHFVLPLPSARILEPG